MGYQGSSLFFLMEVLPGGEVIGWGLGLRSEVDLGRMEPKLSSWVAWGGSGQVTESLSRLGSQSSNQFHGGPLSVPGHSLMELKHSA